MPMTQAEIVALVKQSLPDASIQLQDTRGDSDHYVITVTSPQFKGKSRIERHKMVLDSLGNVVTSGKLHSISINTMVPGEQPAMNPDVFARIRADIEQNEVVLFMKGTKAEPQCGFSGTVVQVLDQMGVRNYKAVDVLADPAVREGIKQFTNWPTVPQLYVKGEFIGGCDIVREMQASGELLALLRDKGVKLAA